MAIFGPPSQAMESQNVSFLMCRRQANTKGFAMSEPESTEPNVPHWCANESRHISQSPTPHDEVQTGGQTDKSFHLYVNQKGDQSIIPIWIKTPVPYAPLDHRFDS